MPWNCNRDDLGVSLPAFPSRTTLKRHNIPVAPKLIKKIDSSNMSGPGCISVVFLKNIEPELSYMLAELLNTCLKESCFLDCGRCHMWSLYLITF